MAIRGSSGVVPRGTPTAQGGRWPSLERIRVDLCGDEDLSDEARNITSGGRATACSRTLCGQDERADACTVEHAHLGRVEHDVRRGPERAVDSVLER
jgi:hypothetical protein